LLLGLYFPRSCSCKLSKFAAFSLVNIDTSNVKTDKESRVKRIGRLHSLS
jgi:hypothetical protein